MKRAILPEREPTGSEKSLKDANLYTDLQVCLIPKGDETTAGYTVRQENWDDKFGNVSLQVPAGEYTLVAVAAKLICSRKNESKLNQGMK